MEIVTLSTENPRPVASPATRRDRATAETRGRILDAARQLFEERGVTGVGVDEIARAAGVSRQAVYQRHFASKSELLLALVDRVDADADIPRHVQRFLGARTALDTLDAAVEIHAAIEPQLHRIAQVLDAARISDPAVEATWQDRMAARRNVARIVIERLAGEGLLAEGWSQDAATDYAWSLMSVWTYQALVVERGWSTDQYVDRLKDVLRATLVRAGG